MRTLEEEKSCKGGGQRFGSEGRGYNSIMRSFDGFANGD